MSTRSQRRRLPGETLEVKQGTLFINGALLDDEHGMQPGLLLITKGKLLAGDFAILGVNRYPCLTEQFLNSDQSAVQSVTESLSFTKI